MKYLLIIVLALACSSCVTYSRFLRKFGHLAKDSVTITKTIPVAIADTVYVPGDTVSTIVSTDTTDLYKVVDGKRAKLTFDRKRGLTRITAEAKPDTLIRTIRTTVTLRAKCPPVATFGVAPWYRWAFFASLALLVILGIAFTFKFIFKVSIARR